MGYGNLKRPWRYREGQRRAIDLLGFPEVDKSLSILDVGCGIGTGMLYFKKLGFEKVIGIDNDSDRICLAERRKLDVFQMSMEDLFLYKTMEDGVMVFPALFDIVWSSHSFEHSVDPDKTLEILNYHTHNNSLFFFILPYPDSNPAELHTASREIGLDIDDDGMTVARWFIDRGLELQYIKRDGFREPEIWMRYGKKKT